MIQSLQDPDKEKHDQARQRAEAHLEKLSRRRAADGSDDEDTDDSRHRRRIQELKLNEYENLIAMEMVAPEEIPVGFDGM